MRTIKYLFLRFFKSFAAVTAGLALLANTVFAATFTVDTPIEDNDLVPGDGTCLDGNGDCSFTAALEEVNSLAGTHTIDFDNSYFLQGNSDVDGYVWKIGPNTGLPGGNADGLTIDGGVNTVEFANIGNADEAVFGIEADNVTFTNVYVFGDGVNEDSDGIHILNGSNDVTLDGVQVGEDAFATVDAVENGIVIDGTDVTITNSRVTSSEFANVLIKENAKDIIIETSTLESGNEGILFDSATIDLNGENGGQEGLLLGGVNFANQNIIQTNGRGIYAPSAADISGDIDIHFNSVTNQSLGGIVFEDGSSADVDFSLNEVEASSNGVNGIEINSGNSLLLRNEFASSNISNNVQHGLVLDVKDIDLGVIDANENIFVTNNDGNGIVISGAETETVEMYGLDIDGDGDGIAIQVEAPVLTGLNIGTDGAEDTVEIDNADQAIVVTQTANDAQINLDNVHVGTNISFTGNGLTFDHTVGTSDVTIDNSVVGNINGDAVTVATGVNDFTFRGNYVGVDNDGTTNIANGNRGLVVVGEHLQNVIIGAIGQENVFRHNADDGVQIASTVPSLAVVTLNNNTIINNGSIGVQILAGAVTLLNNYIGIDRLDAVQNNDDGSVVIDNTAGTISSVSIGASGSENHINNELFIGVRTDFDIENESSLTFDNVWSTTTGPFGTESPFYFWRNSVSALFGPQMCNDSFDNDGDTLVDLNDPGCENLSDNNENDPNISGGGGGSVGSFVVSKNNNDDEEEVEPEEVVEEESSEEDAVEEEVLEDEEPVEETPEEEQVEDVEEPAETPEEVVEEVVEEELVEETPVVEQPVIQPFVPVIPAPPVVINVPEEVEEPEEEVKVEEVIEEFERESVVEVTRQVLRLVNFKNEIEDLDEEQKEDINRRVNERAQSRNDSRQYIFMPNDDDRDESQAEADAAGEDKVFFTTYDDFDGDGVSEVMEALLEETNEDVKDIENLADEIFQGRINIFGENRKTEGIQIVNLPREGAVIGSKMILWIGGLTEGEEFEIFLVPVDPEERDDEFFEDPVAEGVIEEGDKAVVELEFVDEDRYYIVARRKNSNDIDTVKVEIDQDLDEVIEEVDFSDLDEEGVASELVGEAESGDIVVVTWQSVIQNSVVIADSKGKFELGAPTAIAEEKGRHKATVYTYNPSSNLFSGVRSLLFNR
jgi:hypothetical protein